MFAKPTEVSFFVYILRREKSPLATFSPKGFSHTADGLPAKGGQSTPHSALPRLAAQMGLPGSSDLQKTILVLKKLDGGKFLS